MYIKANFGISMFLGTTVAKLEFYNSLHVGTEMRVIELITCK